MKLQITVRLSKEEEAMLRRVLLEWNSSTALNWTPEEALSVVAVQGLHAEFSKVWLNYWRRNRTNATRHAAIKQRRAS